MVMKTFLLFVLLFSSFGFLRTHQEILEDDGEEDLIYKNSSETKLTTSTSQTISVNQKDWLRLKQRVDFLEKNCAKKQDLDTAFEHLNKEISVLKTKEETLQAEASQNQKKNNQKKKQTPPAKEDLFQKAENFFEKKDYKKAIFAYEEFRKQHPDSSKFKTATLKIGLSFYHLDLKKEAEVFFKEVVDRFAGSKEALKAVEMLKSV